MICEESQCLVVLHLAHGRKLPVSLTGGIPSVEVHAAASASELRCFHPLEAAWQGTGDKPKVFKKGTRPDQLSNGFMPIDLPCGQCIGCRLTNAQNWAFRCMHEGHDCRTSFITLTYDDDHLPFGGTLVPYHLECFWKRFRRRIEPIKIRYYAAGEYGSQCEDHGVENCPVCGPLQRPHYHAIIFGFDFPDKEYLTERDGYPVYTSDFLAMVWPYGIHEIGSLTYESAGYVARYCAKKRTGKGAADHYAKYIPGLDTWIELQPEFGRMSQGLGERFYEKYKDDIYPSDEVPIPGVGVYGKPGRYYDNIYTLTNPIEMVDIKLERERLFREFNEREQPSLASQEKVALAKSNQLKRALK